MRASKAITASQLTAVVERFKNQQLPLITARTARQKLAEVDNGAPYIQFVDGREGAPLESVRPGGQILFKFNRLGPVIDWLYRQLVGHSPIGKNVPPHLHYFQDHVLYMDGERIDVGVGEIAELPPGAVAMIVNERDYARRLEFGWSSQAPEGVYEVTALAAQRLFPYVSIVFSWVSLAEVAATSPRASTRRVLHARHAQHADYRYPAITVTAR